MVPYYWSRTIWKTRRKQKKSQKTYRSLHQPDIDTLLTGCKDCGWSFLLHRRQYDSGIVPESAGLCVACSRASKKLYLESLGNAGLLGLSAWTSRSTQGRMEGLTHASSHWWYDLRLATNFYTSMCHDGQKVGRSLSVSREDCSSSLHLRNSWPHFFQMNAFLDPIVFQSHVLHDY